MCEPLALLIDPLFFPLLFPLEAKVARAEQILLIKARFAYIFCPYVRAILCRSDYGLNEDE